MTNLNDFGVSELNTKDMKHIDGGWWSTLVKEALKGALVDSAWELIKATYEELKKIGEDYEIPEWQQHKMGGL